MNPRDHIPLRPVEFQILASLSQGERHGYAILQEMEANGEGQDVPGLATLYRAIVRLEKQSLIARVEDTTPVPEFERRRVYRLSPLGRAVVSAEARRLAPLVDLVKEATP